MRTLKCGLAWSAVLLCLWATPAASVPSPCKQKCGTHRCVLRKAEDLGPFEVWEAWWYDRAVAFEQVWCKEPAVGGEGNCAPGNPASSVHVIRRYGVSMIVCENAPATDWQTGHITGEAAGQCRWSGTTEYMAAQFTECHEGPIGE